ncbi:hypothetical protein QT196_36340 [Streptomyces sp. P9-2B-2]|uniref:hypothetical protein n=1 Tax=Streptomyces TaxID=1883 RepID=UPI002001DED2|nr:MULTISPECIES: hypothetical protein [Streptomyces]MCX4638698.1 hypothetical protein [Streptomyces platensis]WJY42282.1 hypothetical protein QT196_36340 [Streptomyces sp. P9-2B-2]
MADRQAGLYGGQAARYFAPLHRDAIDAVEAAQKHLDAVAPRAVIDTSIVDDGQLLRETWEAAELDMRRSLWWVEERPQDPVGMPIPLERAHEPFRVS